MRAETTLAVGILLIGTLLAGCAEEVPPVTVIADQEGVSGSLTGMATVAFQDAYSPADDTTMGTTGTIDETSGGNTSCAADEAPMAPDEYRCLPAMTSVNISFEALPDPGAGSYHAFLTNNESEFDLGELVYNEHATHEGEMTGPLFGLNATFQENLEGHYDTIEVRYADFVVTRVAFAAGNNVFTVAPEILEVAVEAAYLGNQITVTTANLPSGADPVGWLVEYDADGEKLHSVSFPLSGNVTDFTSERPIADFAEFHVHVGASKINIAIAELAPPAA